VLYGIIEAGGGVMLDFTVGFALLLLFLGILFLVIEAFIPGFGFFGAGGLLLIVGSAVYSAVYLPYGIVIACGEVLLIIGIVIFIVSYYKKHHNTMAVILNETLNEDKDKEDFGKYIGKTGVVKTPLKPFGNIEIDGEFVEAYAENEFIAQGKTVICKTTSNGKLFVREVYE
jgi:membrane-bound serine protease (ClpP class)